MREKITFFAIIICLLASSAQLNGQVVKLTKVISGGGIPSGGTPPPTPYVYNNLIFNCLNGQTNDFDLEIHFQQIGYNVDFNITSIGLSSQNTTLNLAHDKLPISVSQSQGATFNVSHTNNWNTLNSTSIEFDLVVWYTLLVGNTLITDYDVFQFNLDICSTSLEYTYIESIKSKSQNRIATDEISPDESDQKISESIIISPNPTKGEFQVNYSLEEDATIDIAIYNSVGQKIKTIVDNEQRAKGDYQINNNLSEEFASGIYYIIFRVGKEIRTERLVKL